MRKDSKIYVAGHRGLAGSAILRCLEKKGCRNLVCRNHSELDLTRQAAVEAFFEEERPDFVFLAAAKVGGILANSTLPAEFIYENLAIQTHVLHAAWKSRVKRLLFLGSSCIYPRLAPQPIEESHLLTGELEATNELYAVAKIAGIKMCQSYNRQYGTRFLSVMPTNLYGPNDNFDLESSHVLPALIRRFHEAKESGADTVTVWGTGNPRREFLHGDDMAEAACFLMDLSDDVLDGEFFRSPLPSFINIGTGTDIAIGELAALIAEIVGFRGEIRFDDTKPDGTPRKLLDVSRLRRLGWEAKIGLREGIERTYRWFLENRRANGGPREGEERR